MKPLRITLLAFAPVVAAVAVVILAVPRQHHAPAALVRPVTPRTSEPAPCPPPDTRKRYLGVVVYRPQQLTLPRFVALSGTRPAIIEYYVGFGSSFNMARAALIRRSAFPIVQVDPYRVSLRAIAAGHYDAYLRRQARAVARFRCPIAVSFGHEMNGRWYSWGLGHVPPGVFTAAWRRICQVFASAGAHNVIWTWTVNRVSPSVSAPLSRWWPGQRYVDWVGIDGYYRTPRNTFTGLFGGTLRQIQHLTRDPVLITETSVTRKGPQAALIKDLFEGARKAGLFGVVWFNISADQQWPLAGRPGPVLAAFREAAGGFVR